MFKSTTRRLGWISAALLVFAPACGGDDGGGGADSGPTADSSPTADAEPSTITVQGTVFDYRGAPHPNVGVYIEGTMPTFTDGSGSFTVEGVEPPYDVLLSMPSIPAAVQYVGLSSAEPELVTILQLIPQDSTATIEGTAVGGDSDFISPGLVNYRTEYHLHADRATGTRIIQGAQATTPFDIAAGWQGGDTLSGTVHALQYVRDGDGRATDFTAYGSAEVTELADDGTENVTINMQAVSDEPVSGTVTTADNVTFGKVETYIRLSDGFAIEASDETPSGDSFTHMLPGGIPDSVGCARFYGQVAPAGTVAVVRGNFALPANDLAITLPSEVPSQTSPADDATDVGVGSQLEFSGVDGAAHMVLLVPAGGSPNDGIFILITTEETVTIPETTAFGVSLGENQAYSWGVNALYGVASPDDMGPAILDLTSLCGSGPDSFEVSSSALQTFTTP